VQNDWFIKASWAGKDEYGSGCGVTWGTKPACPWRYWETLGAANLWAETWINPTAMSGKPLYPVNSKVCIHEAPHKNLDWVPWMENLFPPQPNQANIRTRFSNRLRQGSFHIFIHSPRLKAFVSHSTVHNLCTLCSLSPMSKKYIPQDYATVALSASLMHRYKGKQFKILTWNPLKFPQKVFTLSTS
jgi:hypothetical protein